MWAGNSRPSSPLLIPAIHSSIEWLHVSALKTDDVHWRSGEDCVTLIASAFFARLVKGGPMKHRPLFLILFVLLFLCLVGVLVGAAPARASTTITVSTTSDELNDDGQCSLREAIRAANLDAASGVTPGECPAGSGADTITFASNVTGSINILPLSSPLPMVTDTLSIVGPGTALLQEIGRASCRERV